MNDDDRGKLYQEAVRQLEQYIRRMPDGSLHIEPVDAAKSGVDPVIMADLLRSLEVTNRMIQRGEIKPDQVQMARA